MHGSMYNTQVLHQVLHQVQLARSSSSYLMYMIMIPYPVMSLPLLMYMIMIPTTHVIPQFKGDPATASALVAAVSKIALMARILPDREQLQQARAFGTWSYVPQTDRQGFHPCDPCDRPFVGLHSLPTDQAPQLALTHFNDLRHLADSLLVLPVTYGRHLDPVLAQQQQQQGGEGGTGAEAGARVGSRLNFLEDTLLLRQAAEEVLNQQVGWVQWDGRP